MKQYINQQKKNYNFKNNLILNDGTRKKIKKLKNKIELMNDKIKKNKL